MKDAVYPNGYYYFIDENENIKAISQKTGEVTDAVVTVLPIGSQSLTPDAQRERRKHMEQSRQKMLRREINKDLGNFFFLSYAEQFPDISPQSVARLLFLNTFADYDSNVLVTVSRNGKLPILRKDLPSILGVSKALVSKFWQEVSPKYLVETSKGLISTNTDIFIKRKLSRKKYANLQKLYNNGIRKLYRETDASRHKHLGYVLQMLPYINIEFNILCKNPFEEKLENIQAMSLTEFCDLIGYNSSQHNRLENIYYNIRFEVKDSRERFCSFVYDGFNKDDVKIFINPNILYNGSDYQKVEVLGAFCK